MTKRLNREHSAKRKLQAHPLFTAKDVASNAYLEDMTLFGWGLLKGMFRVAPSRTSYGLHPE